MSLVLPDNFHDRTSPFSIRSPDMRASVSRKTRLDHPPPYQSLLLVLSKLLIEPDKRLSGGDSHQLLLGWVSSSASEKIK
jgi:hypothetical protein